MEAELPEKRDGREYEQKNSLMIIESESVKSK